MKKEDAQKWANALRSGDYRQGATGYLRDSNGGYCCLGVLCDVFPELDLDSSLLVENHKSPSTLPGYRRIGLNCELGEICNNISFAELNDGDCDAVPGDMGRFSFDEIADIIEIEYVHGL